MSHLISFDVTKEITAVVEKYRIDKIEIIAVLQQTLTNHLGRDVLLVSDNTNILKVLRRNKNGEFSDVKYKAFKKGMNPFCLQLETMSCQKHIEKIFSMFDKKELVEGLILDRTVNGYFVVVKGEKAFFPKSNTYAIEEQRGMYELDNKILFQVEKIVHGKIYLTRKSIKISVFAIQNIIGKSVKLKKISSGLILFCSKPYLDEAQMAMIRANVPQKIIFKKEKEGY